MLKELKQNTIDILKETTAAMSIFGFKLPFPPNWVILFMGVIALFLQLLVFIFKS